jgi:hypothetical protein
VPRTSLLLGAFGLVRRSGQPETELSNRERLFQIRDQRRQLAKRSRRPRTIALDIKPPHEGGSATPEQSATPLLPAQRGSERSLHRSKPFAIGP